MKKDPNQKIFYEINKEIDYSEDIDFIIHDIEEKLALRLRNEGDKVKNWALSNKFAKKDKKKTQLNIYFQAEIAQKMIQFTRKYQNKKQYKWIQIR